jgi:hypothetical protein
MLQSQSQSDVTSGSQAICQGIEPTLGLVAGYYFLSKGFRLVYVVMWLECGWEQAVKGTHSRIYFTIDDQSLNMSLNVDENRKSRAPKAEVSSRLTISHSICLGIEHPCGTYEQTLLPVGMYRVELNVKFCNHSCRDVTKAYVLPLLSADSLWIPNGRSQCPDISR